MSSLTYLALHTFDPNGPNQLAFQEGDELQVYDRDASPGWYAAILGEAHGLVPANYLEPTTDARKAIGLPIKKGVVGQPRRQLSLRREELAVSLPSSMGGPRAEKGLPDDQVVKKLEHVTHTRPRPAGIGRAVKTAPRRRRNSRVERVLRRSQTSVDMPSRGFANSLEANVAGDLLSTLEEEDDENGSYGDGDGGYGNDDVDGGDVDGNGDHDNDEDDDRHDEEITGSVNEMIVEKLAEAPSHRSVTPPSVVDPGTPSSVVLRAFDEHDETEFLQLQQSYQVLEVECCGLQEQVAELQAKCAQLEEEAEQSRGTVSSLMELNSAMEEKHRVQLLESSRMIEELAGNSNDHRVAVEKMESRTREKEAENLALERDIFEEEQRELEERAAALETEQRELRQLKIDIAAAQAELDREKDRQLVDAEEIEIGLQELEAERRAIQNAQAAHAAAHADLRGTAAAATLLRNELSKQRAEQDALQREYDTMKAEMAAMAKGTAEAEEARRVAGEKAFRSLQNLESVTLERDNLLLRAMDLEAKATTMRGEVSDMKAQRDQCEARQIQAVNELEVVQRKCGALQEEITNLSEEATRISFNEDVAALRHDREQCLIAQEESDAKCKDLTERLEAVSREHEETKQDNVALVEEVAQMQEELKSVRVNISKAVADREAARRLKESAEADKAAAAVAAVEAETLVITLEEERVRNQERRADLDSKFLIMRQSTAAQVSALTMQRDSALAAAAALRREKASDTWSNINCVEVIAPTKEDHPDRRSHSSVVFPTTLAERVAAHPNGERVARELELLRHPPVGTSSSLEQHQPAFRSSYHTTRGATRSKNTTVYKSVRAMLDDIKSAG